MTIEVIILLAIVLAAMLVINKLSDKMQEIHSRFDALNRELQKLRSELEITIKRSAETKLSEPVKETPAPEPILMPEPALPVSPSAPPIAEPELQEKQTGSEETIPEMAEKAEPALVGNEIFEPAYASVSQQEEVQLGFMERFLQNNPDLEKFIGENLINKIGIAILVLGIGYFVKFAIDKDWINEIGRVAIGIAAGGILVGVAHRLRNTFNAFSSVLVGGGLAVLYFTIAIAFHEYHIFNQTAAFLIMAVITGFSVLLAVSYNRVELAVLSLLGGFATPFMVSTGEGNYIVLFTYILILNIGMLVLAYLKNWKIINWIAYGFTILLFGGWLSTRVLNNNNGPYLGALLFATAFYVVFFLMNIVNNLKRKAHFTTADISILLSNTFLYYSAGMLVLHEISGGLYQGLFTAAVAVFNFVFAFLLFRNQKADRNLIYLLIGLVITFISLAIPVQLEGNYITLFWALEAVLLLWFAQRSGLKLIVISSMIISFLMLVSLLMDWQAIYMSYTPGTSYNILLNKGFITSLVSILSLGGIMWLLKKQPEPIPFKRFDFEPMLFYKITGFVVVVLVYLALLLELNYHLNLHLDSSNNRVLILGSYNLAFIAGLFTLARYQQKESTHILVTLLGMFGVFLYSVWYNPTVLQLLKAHFLQDQSGIIGFAFHYLNLLLVVSLLISIYRNLNIIESHWAAAPKVLLWVLAGLVVYFASSELLYHVLYFNLPATNAAGLQGEAYTAYNYEHFYNLSRQTYKVGFPILWGICAFVFMYVGLRWKNKHLRIISLSLFSITLLKLFLFDIRGISEGGKIAAFIFLGVVLLVISFMYQKIKTLLLADEKVSENQDSL